MYCEYCGAKQPEKNKFCTNCGAKLAVLAEEPVVLPVAEAVPAPAIEPVPETVPTEAPAAKPQSIPVPEKAPAEKVVSAPVIPAAPEQPAAPKTQIPGEAPADHNPLYHKDTLMKWFHYLIKFGLIVDAVIHILMGIHYANGGRFTDPLVVEFIYTSYPGLKIVDLAYCVLMIALGALMIVTRIHLAKYKKTGPKLLLITNVIDLILPGLYLAGMGLFLPVTENDLSAFVTSVAIYAAIFFINLSYFKKRKHLFIN